MGYRSEVKIIAQANAAKALREVNKKWGYLTETEGTNGEWLFECDWIKWYEEDEDIAAYMAVIEAFADKTGEGNGIDYMRLGEDSTDVEHLSNYTTTATLCSGIVVDGFTPKPKPPKPATPKVGKEFLCCKSFTHENLGPMLRKGKIYVCSKQEKNGNYQMTAKKGMGGCCCDTAFFKTHFTDIK